MLGQSIPIATVAGIFAGTICGEAIRSIAEECGASEGTQRILAQIGHGLSNASVGYAINTAMGLDVTGASVQTVTAATGAFYHNEFANFILGNGQLPSTR